MDPLSLVAGVGGSLVSGLFNADQAEQNREFNAQQAQINRDFQERMASTSYQRGMADMRAAGLNPILAYQRGGASAPSGSSASGTPATMPDLGQHVSSANQATRMTYEIENLKEQNNLLKAQTIASERDAELKHASAQKVAQDINVARPSEIVAGKAVEHTKSPWGDLGASIAGGARLAEPILGAANSAASFATRFGAAFGR